MSLYKYDTHIHTSEGSACADFGGKEQARLYKELGYDGIIITDHFYNGNTAVSRELPWEEWVEGFCKGYEEALKEGGKIGLSVFFGWEETIEEMDFLVYGLDKEWLTRNESILYMDLPKHYRRIKESGGYIIHAHPYRKREHPDDLKAVPEFADAIEIVNGANGKEIYNQMAMEYAAKWKKPVTGGSDAHHKNDRHGGIKVGKPLSCIRDYIEAVEKREIEEIISFAY